jgi:hypothetical protein
VRIEIKIKTNNIFCLFFLFTTNKFVKDVEKLLFSTDFGENKRNQLIFFIEI